MPAVAALWTGIERTDGPLGFAWLALGNAGGDMSIRMRLAPVTGVYGLSFLLVMISVAIALVLLRRPWIHLFWLAALPAAFLLPALPESGPAAESAVSVQPNIDEQWNRPEVDALDRRLAILSLQSAPSPDQKPPRKILWPEVPAPIYWDTDLNRKDQDTASRALDSNLEMRETVPKEKQCRSANWERAAWKFRRSGSAAWE